MKKSYVSVLAMMLVIGAMAGCKSNRGIGNGSSQPEEVRSGIQSENTAMNQPKTDLDCAIAVSNHTYIPLNIGGRSDVRIWDVLDDLTAFEKAHPNIKITNWRIEKHQYPEYRLTKVTFGLWVDHEPRSK